MRRLLLVDDERSVVDGLKKVLRPWREQWEVETAVGGEAGLEALRSGRMFDAIVSDARMPNIDGEAVLNFARVVQPQAVRVVLSGQVDAKTSHRLASVSHQFLSKPSSAPALVAAIEECRRLLDSLQGSAARSLVTGMGTLPVGPKVYLRITSLIDQPETSVKEVAEIVEADVALSASVLRFANSSFFALARKLSSVREAVVLMGLEPLRELVLLSEVFRETDALGVVEEIQSRCLLRAQLSRLVTEGSAVSHVASEAALLTDVGMLAFASRMPESYGAVWRRFRSGEAPLSVIEQEVFGVTHAEVGAVLLSLWSLPEAIVNAVRWHHVLPDEGAELDARTATALVTLLDEERLPTGTPFAAQKLARQLGVESRLPAFREFVGRGGRAVGDRSAT